MQVQLNTTTIVLAGSIFELSLCSGVCHDLFTLSAIVSDPKYIEEQAIHRMGCFSNS